MERKDPRTAPALAAALLAAQCAVATAAAASGAPPELRTLDAYVESVREAFDVPGLSLALVKDGRIERARGYGVLALSGAPATGHTRFPIASNTKAFTATALALLVDDGLLQWDEPVSRYLPEFALADPYVTKHLSVRDLLAHNSGLPAGAGDLLWWPATTHSTAELVRRLRFLPLERTFRQGYAYDNVLYTVAGELIARVSDAPWSDFVKQRLLDPLGMRDTILRRPGFVGEDNVASPHAVVDGELRAVAPFSSDKTNPSGGLVASSHDMALWMKVQLARGRLDGNERLFSEQSAEALWSVVAPMPPGKPRCGIAALAAQFRGYALGLVVQDYRGHKVLTHTGGAPGYVSQLTLVPGIGLGVAVLTNQQSIAAVIAITNHIVDAYLGAADTNWLSAMRACDAETKAKRPEAAAAPVPARSVDSMPRLPVAAYAGRYRDAWYGDIEIRRLAADRLEMAFLHTPSLVGEMQHWRDDTFVVRWYDAPLPPNAAFVRFALKADGSIESATMSAVSPETDFSYDFSHLRLLPVP